MMALDTDVRVFDAFPRTCLEREEQGVGYVWPVKGHGANYAIGDRSD